MRGLWRLREGIRMTARRFPIKNAAPGFMASIAWETVERCEDQARKNHGQDLEQLAAEGGLTYLQLLAVLVGCTDYPVSPDDAPLCLETLLADPVEVPR